MFLYNQWYIAAWDDEIGQEPIQRWFLDIPVTLYRTEAGEVVAMEDRCPHRLAPLSMGERCGDNIRCIYHGAEFSPSGECVSMPGTSAQAREATVRVFATEERWGTVWIWMGKADEADPDLLPPASKLRAEGRRTVRGLLPCKADYKLCIDNVLDLSHEAYLHPNTIGTLDVAEFPVKTKVNDQSITIARVMSDVPAPPLFVNARGIKTNIDRYQTVTGYPPSFVTVDVKAVPTGEPESDDQLEWQVLFFFTPERAGSCHYFFALSRSFALDSEEVDKALIEGTLRTLNEDIEMLEAQQGMVADVPLDQRTLYSRYDVGPDRFRTLVDEMMAKEQAATDLHQRSAASIRSVK